MSGPWRELAWRDMGPLPIDAALPALRDALRARSAAVLQAPPGAGKTTRVPLALLEEPWLNGLKIVMLEPRRLAARAAARRMAQTLRESVGDTVGYRVRLDTRVGPATRIEVVTEGILTRMLQEDAALEEVGLVVLDEFHERSLQADLGLALTLQSRALLREDLRVLVMSATLDGGPVARLLDDAPIISSEGRTHRVETRYHDRPVRSDRNGPARIEPLVASTILAALRGDEGDVLVFLPGAAEIRRVERALIDRGVDPHVLIAPLHGSLPIGAQDRAILPAPAGARKVVLATSIAETSLTIEGVRVVVDSGLSRVPRFSARTGMTRLETTRVSRASADQRRGRAGRTAPGVCYRLWPEHEDHHLLARTPPEILEADLAPLALELAAAGITDPGELRWLDPPPAAALAQGRELLRQLDAIDPADHITPHGRRMRSLGVHPRLAHMILRAEASGDGALACDLAALLAERDIVRMVAGVPDPDVRPRLELLHQHTGAAAAHPAFAPADVDREAVRRVRESAAQLRRQLGIGAAVSALERAGSLLACAYPDRVAQRRPGERARYLLRNGRGAMLDSAAPLGDADLLVVAELDDRRPESRIFLAAPLTLDELLAQFGEQIAPERIVAWDADSGSIVAHRRERLGAIVLREVPLRDVAPAEIARAVAAGIAREGVAALPWTDSARRLQQRLIFARTLDPANWPDASDEALGGTMLEWLPGRVAHVRRRDDLARVDLSEVLRSLLDWPQRAALEELAPTHVVVPSGSRVAVDYADPRAPVLAVRLQEMFGARDTPRIGGGRVPLTLHLLSPAQRPVQVTRDLAGFWRSSYFDVKKDLRGRYPKHYWPDDPLEAEPTRRTKKRP